MNWRVFPVVFCFIILAAVVQAQEPQTQPQDLSGTWVLNKNMSDDLQQTMMAAKGRRGGGNRGGRGGGVRNGGMGGGRSGGSMARAEVPTGREQSPQALKMIKNMEKGFSRIEIFHDGVELNITDGLDISRLLHTDGRTNTIWTERGESLATANWDKKTLVVHWSGKAHGPKKKDKAEKRERIRHYHIDQATGHLIVVDEVNIPGNSNPVKIRLVYDRQS